MENYETLGTIGEGTYGVVLKARHKETGQIVAIKKFKESDEDEQVRKTALREVRILKQLKHDNIVNLIEVFRRKSKLHLVFEFVERTILEDLERNPDGMDPIECKKCLWQLLRSIDYCHAHNVIHRDIKPENLLISRNGILKLCDFGFARTLAGPGARYTDYVATRWYRGPELLTGDTQYGKPVDIWAIGCMLPEMASGAPLFPGESDIDQLFHIMRCFGQLPPKLMEIFRSNPLFIGIKIPDQVQCTETLEKRFPQYPEDQLVFMRNCLKYEPEQRCTCEELMQHRYFTEDGFVAWFEEELKQMLERDAQDFKMRQKKFRKSKNSRGDPGDDGGRRPHSQQAHGSHPPPLSTKADQQHLAQQQHMAHQQFIAQQHGHSSQFGQPMPSVGDSSGADEFGGRGGHEILQPIGGANVHYGGHSSDLVTPPLESAERRPATRGSEKDMHADPNDGEMPLLPNLNRPTTPRAQRLVAFPHLASAMEDTGPPPMPHSRMWGAPPMPSQGKGKHGGHHDVPSMPHLQHQGGMGTQRAEGGSSNLPLLREGQLFADQLPDRHLHAQPAPLNQPRGTGKKKSSYDPNNPYSSKSGNKSKSKAWGKSNHSMGSSQASSSQMGVVGQAQSIAGLAAAYALPPSSMGSTLPPRTPNHDMHMMDSAPHLGPPRTPQEGSSIQFGLDAHPMYAGPSNSMQGQMAGSHLHGGKLHSSQNYSGGQYAKYGKRY